MKIEEWPLQKRGQEMKRGRRPQLMMDNEDSITQEGKTQTIQDGKRVFCGHRHC